MIHRGPKDQEDDDETGRSGRAKAEVYSQVTLALWREIRIAAFRFERTRKLLNSMNAQGMTWLFCICVVCFVETSSGQLHLNTNPYRPLLDQSSNYVGVLQKELSLEFKIDKMPSRSYDWLFVATGIKSARIHLFQQQLRRIKPQSGGRHTCAIKAGVGWIDGIDYTDRLFCFGRNIEGQLDPPIETAQEAWETVCVAL